MHRSVSLALVLLGTASVPAQSPPTPLPESPTAHNQRMAWWREARFGMFIHWGLYAIPAGEWQGDTGHAEWIRETARIPLAEYERFVPQFNPTAFDADAWAALAADAGMRYIVITSKHHDGFCLFDSAHTDFDIMSTPYHRDILGALADAARRRDLRIGWYHSIMDWHHPDYLPRRGWERADRPEAGADFDRFLAYLHAQVRELLTNYGAIDVMWFDGEWESTWSHEQGVALYNLVRTLSPSTIINNRVDVGRAGMAGLTRGPEFAGDFGTPEQEVPPHGLPGVDWETCLTLNDHWGYNRHDTNWKSTTQLLHTLVDVASKGGNLLLNVGPTADGRIPAPCITRLHQIGRWLRTNGDAIYATQASPFPAALPWGRCTMRPAASAGDQPTTLYFHVFDWPTDGRLAIPGVDNRVLCARLLANGRTLPVAPRVGGFTLELPSAAPDPAVSVIALDIVGPPIVLLPPQITAADDIFVEQMPVEITPGMPGVELRYTTDGSDPHIASPPRPLRFTIDHTTEIRAQHFRDGRPLTEISSRTITQVTPRPAAPFDRLQPGLRYEYFEGNWDALPDFDRLTPAATGVAPTLTLDLPRREEAFGLRFRGKLLVPRAAVYEFGLASDDGSRLLIGDQLVVDNDGPHVMQEARGRIALAAGAHPITIEFFERTGQQGLTAWFAEIASDHHPLAPGVLFTD